MTATPAHVPVLAAPHWTPDAACIELDVPHGLTVAEIVRMALPGATDAELMRARVALVTPRGMSIIAPKHWRYLRPNPDVQVVIRIIPGKNSVRKILMIVVAVGAVALGQTWALSLGLGSAAATSLAASVFAGGLTFLGNLVINALIPPETPAGRETRTTYSISGVKNRLTPNGAVPVILGKMRVAPPFAMTPYTEIVGDQQYLRCLFVIGEGQVGIDDMRLGETSLAEYDEVETEVRYGVAGEAAGSLCPRQVFEEQIGVELTRPLPRDDAGGVIKGDPAIETPVVRTTGADASGACIILSWPAGLIRFNDNGDPRSRTVCVRIEQRRVDATEWQQVADLDIAAKRAEGFFRQHSWEFPSRGRWQVRLTMLTDENTSTRIQQRTTWAALQTLRPEYPLAYPRPLALVALRIKATHQLSGALDDFNCLVTRICPDWDSATGSWIPRATENPASLYRHILQDPALPEPRTNAQIDLDQLEAWHAFCTAQGLTYNAALSDTGTTLHDILTEVAAAGRATPRHDGRTYGVVIDQPTDDTLIVDHISPRNSWGFKARRSYFKPPHASVVTFLDADNDYKQTQRTIRWPGFDGDIEVTEELPMSGKVYASEVWREARRRQLEALYRPDTFEATQDGLFRVATRGDAVITNHTTLQRDHMTGRVRRVFGDLIEIDDIVLMEADLEYAVRFRWFEDADDVVGVSVVRLVKTVAGEASVLSLTGVGPVPAVGEIVQFGRATSTGYQHIVRSVEVTTDACSILSMVAAAPEIDTILAATPIPAWSSRVGAELDSNTLQPSVPQWLSVASGVSGTGAPDLISYLIAPGSGAVPASTIEIQHRLTGATDWIILTIPAANGGGDIMGYVAGQSVEIRARSLSSTDVEGPFTTPVTIIVGLQDAQIPAALDEDGISVTTLLGGALVQIATGTNADTTALQVYRSTSATLDRDADAAGALVSVSPQSSYSITLGDTTRENLILGSSMDTPSQWTMDAGWSMAGGVASHTAGTADAITQAIPMTAGKYYRIGLTTAAATAGTLTPTLTGGTDRPGTAIGVNGEHSDRIQAVSGNDTLSLVASSTYDGTLDDIAFYLETSGCLSQGTHYVWIEPQNVDGVPGPVAGPFPITII